jgi:hypothetical protein
VPPSRYGPTDATAWRIEADFNHYRYGAPIVLTSPCDDPMLDLDFDGEPLLSGTMRIQVNGRTVLERDFGRERAQASVTLEHRGIKKGDLVVVRLQFDRVSVPADDPSTADQRVLTICVHGIDLHDRMAIPSGAVLSR